MTTITLTFDPNMVYEKYKPIFPSYLRKVSLELNLFDLLFDSNYLNS